MTEYIILYVLPLLLLGGYVFLIFRKNGKVYLIPFSLICLSIVLLIIHTIISFRSAVFMSSSSIKVEGLIDLLRTISMYQGGSLLLGMMFLVCLEIRKIN